VAYSFEATQLGREYPKRRSLSEFINRFCAGASLLEEAGPTVLLGSLGDGLAFCC